MYDMEDLQLERRVRAEDAVRDVWLWIFPDGSNLPYGACTNVRCNMKNGSFKSKLSIAQNRIATN